MNEDKKNSLFSYLEITLKKGTQLMINLLFKLPTQLVSFFVIIKHFRELQRDYYNFET